MTAFERVRRTQRSLGVVIGSSVFFWACAMLLGLLTLGAAISALVALPVTLRGIIPIVAVLAAVATLVVLGWRSRFVWSFNRVALWIEERAPELRYALVTAIDPRYQGATAQLMEPVVSRVDTGPFVRTAARRSTLPAAAAFLAALGVFLAIPSKWKAPLTASIIFPGTHRPVGNRLTPLSGTVTPPAYANLPTQTFDEPSTITGLVGSQVVITGHGDPDGISVSLEEIPSGEAPSGLIGDTASYDTTEDDGGNYVPPSQGLSGNGGLGNPMLGGGLGMPGQPLGGMRGNNQPGMQPGMSPGSPDSMGMLPGGGGMGAPRPGLSRTSPAPAPKPRAKAPVKPKPAAHAVHKVVPSALPKGVIVKKVAVVAGGNGWMATFTLADSNPALLKLVDRQYHRSIVVDPRVDQPPVGRLLLPVRDTTLRVDTVLKKITGSLNLSALFNDDIGLGMARFDYIKCSSGTDDPEDIKCVQGTYGTRPFGGAKSGTFNFSIPFASMQLKEGDQLSVRGVIFDNKPKALGGPDSGVTDTRNIRVARKGEYEKLNVKLVPPSADTALVTLRMLIIAVKHLDSVYNVMHTMEHKTYEDSSIKLGGVAQLVKNKVQLIIQEQTGGGQVPEDPRLREADDSLFSAIRDLYVADTHDAVPPLEIAYKRLKDYSNTARYYIRGQLPVPIVNIDRVRLTGKDTGVTTPRTPRQMNNVDRWQYMRTYALAVQQMRASPDSAMETFTLLQVETLRKYPELARAVGDAVAAIKVRKDPASSLLRARRILEGSTAALDTLPLWSGAW